MLYHDAGARVCVLREAGEALSDDEVEAIALEHVRWARANGQSFERIIASVGSFATPNFDNAVVAVARAQARLAGKA